MNSKNLLIKNLKQKKKNQRKRILKNSIYLKHNRAGFKLAIITSAINSSKTQNVLLKTKNYVYIYFYGGKRLLSFFTVVLSMAGISKNSMLDAT